jgi:hypothetical protein
MRKKKLLSDKERAILLKRRFEKERGLVLKKISQLHNFGDHSPAEREARVAACEHDFWLFCRTYLAPYFNTKTQALWHDEMISSLMIPDETTAIAAPRGFAKSTIVSFAFILWCICYQKRHFIVIAMDKYLKAQIQTYRILLQLRHNHRIIADFGKLVRSEQSKGDFTTEVMEGREFSIRVLALGSQMSARGIVNEQFRPDLFICDDLETKQLARNPDRVQQLLEETVISDYYGSLCSQGGWFIVIGTVLAIGSMLYKLIYEENVFEDTPNDWVRRKYRAVETDENGKEYSTWEELHPMEILRKKRKKMGDTKFDQEYQNEPSQNTGKFKTRSFRFADYIPKGLDMSKLILQVDPSHSDLGDNKAMALGGIFKLQIKDSLYGKLVDTQGRRLEEGEYLWIVQMFNRKCSLEEMIEKIYQMDKLWQPYRIWIDGTYGQKVSYRRVIASYEAKKGFKRLKNLKWQDFSNKGKKIDRIIDECETLISSGSLILPAPNSKDTRLTVAQFVNLGKPKVNDDGPDVIAALATNVERGGRRKTKISMW